MATARVTSKHQITIPASIRRSLDLRKGDSLSFEPASDGWMKVRKLCHTKSDGAAIPFLPGDKVLTDDLMKAAIAQGARQSHLRRQR